MKKSIIILAALTLGCFYAKSQTTDGLKITGYIQSQAEYAGKDALQVWTGSYDSEKYHGNDHFLTYGVRRGRIRFTYSKNSAKAVVEINTSEAGVSPIKAYMGWDALDWLSFQAGLINSFFGDELMYLSPVQETMDRTVLTHQLFPGLHEIGLKAILKAPQNSDFKGLKLELAAVSGNGISKTPDGHINFESHLKYDKANSDNTFKYGVGVSYYNGRVNNADTNYFKFENGTWTHNAVQADTKNKREYFGVDAQVTFYPSIGKSNIRGEYLFGTQPSVQKSFTAPKNTQYNSSNPFAYERKFSGGYLYYVQDLFSPKWQSVLKAAYYDFNTKADGKTAVNAYDWKYTNLGLGFIYNPTANVRLSAFYDWYINEEAGNIPGYDRQVPNDVLTLRMQVSF